MINFLKNILRYFGVDRVIFFTLVNRGWSIMAGPVTIYLIARYLTKEEQGYYYTFGSLLGLQIFFELGLSFVIMQCVSHEMAHLEWTSEGTITGDPAAKSRLASLFRFALKCYTGISILAGCLLVPVGLWFFAQKGLSTSSVVWMVPWFIVVSITCFNLFLTPFYGLLEGCGKFTEFAKRGAWMAVIGNALLWCGLTAGGKLFAAPIQSATCAVIGVSWVFIKYGKCIRDILATPIIPGARVSWKKEIFHFQWKVALSWASGYFIFQLINPVLFRYRGPVEAGRMGMSMRIIDSLLSLAFSWVATKSVPFGGYISRRDFKTLDQVFKKAAQQSAGVFLLGSIVFFAAYFAMQAAGVTLISRLLDPLTLLFLFGTSLIHCIVFAQAIYLRAHKDEPFLINTIAVAILCPTIIMLVGPSLGAPGIAVGLFCLHLFIGLPWATWIFFKKRKQWHQEPAPEYATSES